MNVRFSAIFAMLTFCAAAAFAAIDASKIYLVVNPNNANSKKIAEFYCELRGVPKKNIIEIPMCNDGHLRRDYYSKYFENPLIKELVARGAVNAVPTGRQDSYGRDEYIFSGHDIDFLIMCFTPLGVVERDAKRDSPKSDSAAIDSEISARFIPQQTLMGFCKNPLYKNYAAPDMYKALGILRVARLDGPSLEGVKRMLLSAARAEKDGARGRAYIDESKKMRMGDDWLSHCAESLKAEGFDVSVDTRPELFDFSTRYDGMLFYFGWYAKAPASFFADKKFRFAPGAIALHIYSYSAGSMRSRDGWVGAFIEGGAAQTFGNVYEPFLGLTQNPYALLQAYSRGMCAGEAAYASVPALSWQTLWVGDPLYRPFKVSLQEQMKTLEGGSADEYSQYAVIRKMNLLEADGDAARARALGRSWTGRIPDAALVWRLLSDARASGNSAEAAAFAAALAEIPPSFDFFGMYVELADFYAASKEGAPKALAVLKGVFSRAENFELKGILLEKASALCEKYGIETPEEFKAFKKEAAEKKSRAAEVKQK